MRAVPRELKPFYTRLLATLAIIIFFPELSLWIPKVLR
jgi:TRAP-type C4-dicarboxylate transport system permease large subunit